MHVRVNLFYYFCCFQLLLQCQKNRQRQGQKKPVQCRLQKIKFIKSLFHLFSYVHVTDHSLKNNKNLYLSKYFFRMHFVKKLYNKCCFQLFHAKYLKLSTLFDRILTVAYYVHTTTTDINIKTNNSTGGKKLNNRNCARKFATNIK